MGDEMQQRAVCCTTRAVFGNVGMGDAGRDDTVDCATQAVIKNTNMSDEMQQDAVDCAKQALKKFNIAGDIASCIKMAFDKKYFPPWNCIVGRNFVSSITTHETRHFIYFSLGQLDIQLYKNESG